MLEPLRNALADRYRIERELGAGGMATVYLAHDARHDRNVAIKVLHPDLAAALGGERFLAEIKTTAKLQHAHILPLLDSGEAQGFLYYVMPVVTGESLRQRLEREKQLPVADAVRITREVASALDYAHRQGVIHRDIKPENILLHEGQALVADFGIALAVQSSGGQRMTQTGLSLGTPQYMSPEQAMGERIIDARADIYALGAVTYEMLTGEPPFTGATVQSIVAKVMSSEPEPPTHTRKTIPLHIEDAVLTALAKLPADRFASAAEYAAALEQAAGARTTSSRQVPKAGTFMRNRATGVLGAVAVLAATAAVWGWTRNTAAAPRPIVKVIIAPPAGVTLPLVLGVSIAVSRDGSKVAFPGRDSTGTSRIYVRYLDRAEAVVVPGSDNAGIPFFSPDGLSVGFGQRGTIKTVALTGGAIVALCQQEGRGTSWGDDGDIIFSHRGELMRCPPAGGKAETLISPPPGESYVYPSHVPGTRAVLFGITGDSAGAAVLNLDDRTFKRLDLPAINVRYVDPGVLVYGQRGGTLAVVPFDKKSLRVTGPAQRLTDQVLVRNDGTARFDVAQTGTLAHIVNDDDAITALLLVDRQGRTTTLAAGLRRYERPRFSPDGRRIAVGTAAVSTDGSDIWMYSIDSRLVQRLTTDSVSYYPEWDPDGQTIVLDRRGRRPFAHVRISTDGSGSAAAVMRQSRVLSSLHIMPDRRSAVFSEDSLDTGVTSRVLLAPFDNPQAATVLLSSNVRARAVTVSRDGQWMAHVSIETGADEVYVSRVRADAGRVRVSQRGGSEPRFGPNGELFFRAGDTVFVSRLEAGAAPRFGAAKALFGGVFNRSVDHALWDVSPDGTRIVMVRTTPGKVGSRIGLYLNWTDHWSKSGLARVAR